MNVCTDKNTLLEYYDETLTFLPNNSLKKYNLHTIKNFIIHIDKVDSKLIAAETIFNYLTYIRTIGPITSNSQTIELFKTFIYPKAPIYERVGFMLYTSIWLMCLLTLILVIVLFIFNSSLIWYSVPTLCLLIYISLIFYKKLQNKVYGVGW